MKLAFALGVAVVLGGCKPAAPPAAMDAAQRAQVRDSVVAALHAYESAVKSMDSARIVAFYSQDESFRGAMDQTVVARKDLLAWAGSLRGSLKSFEGGIAFDSTVVTVLSPTSAATLSPYVDVMTDTSGVTTTVRGTVTWLWVRGSQGWQLAGGQAATLPPVVTRAEK